MLDTKTPNLLLFRLGRKPDPWSPPDWSRALPNGTFGNRFDDPQGNYRVLYAATQRVSCFIETLARFRPDLSLIAELQEIAGEDDYVPLGTVPIGAIGASWVRLRSREPMPISIAPDGWATYVKHWPQIVLR